MTLRCVGPANVSLSQVSAEKHGANLGHPAHQALGMQTPASVYTPSARAFPAQVPEPEYPASMQVRSVKSHGMFRWKKHDVFLSEVLWGERIGLLAIDDRWFTIYFAEHPIARFDSRWLRVSALPKLDDAGRSITSRAYGAANQATAGSAGRE